jgi:hypothetical protein
VRKKLYDMFRGISGIRDEVAIKHNVRIEVFGPDGELKDFREIHNLVVNAGKTQIAKQMSSSLGTAPTHMAVGTGTTAAAAGDTTLQTEIDRNAVTSNTSASNVQTVVGDWAAGDATNGAISEAGIFNAAAAGTMTARAVFTAIPKGASDTLKITWTITYG